MLVRTCADIFSPTSALCFSTGEGHFKNPLKTLLACKSAYMSEELLSVESTSSEKGEDGGEGDGTPQEPSERLKDKWD